MAGPDDPIAAVRVAPAEAPPSPGASQAAAPELVIASAGAAAAPAVAESVIAAEPAAIELVAERPSLLESVGKEAVKEPAKAEPVKPAAEVAKPEEASPAAEAKPAESVKPAEAKPIEATKPEGEVKPAEPAKPEPLAAIEYKYTLPETLKLDDALKGEMHTAFDAFRANPAEGAQALIDLHSKVVGDLVTQSAAETLRNQHKSFNDTRTQWNKDWAADEQIGGAGYQTALRAIARMRDQFVSDELPGSPKYQADRKSLEEFMRITGAGDHPAFGRLLHNVSRAFDEPPLPPTNGKPPATNGMKPGSKRERMYDHPSSSKTS